MRKITILFLSIILLFSSSACEKGDVIIEIGDSAKFSKEEIVKAIDKVIKNFSFPAATLKKVWYDEEKSEKLITGYLQYGKGSINGTVPDNVIILLSDFYVDSSGVNPVLNPGSTYEDYQWILIRENKESDWIIDDWGY